MSIIRRSRLAALAVGVVALPALVMNAGAVSAAPAINAEQEKAGAWLAAQVPASGLFQSAYEDFETGDPVEYTDYGLNLDLQFVLRELGESAAADTVYDAVVADTAAYTDSGGTRYAGAVGKLATYVELAGDDATAIDDRDLIADLKALMVTEGPETGRFLDSVVFGDGPVLINQAWAVRALGLVQDDAAATGASFLVANQCDDGGFRENPRAATCQSSVDATVFAVTALRAVDSPAYKTAVVEAVTWLVSQQAADGSFVDAGAANTNSTGLAADLLAEVDRGAEATRAGDWIVLHQLTGGPETGAIARTSAARDAVGTNPIATLQRDEFVRATVQAALALPYRSEPVEVGPVASITLALSSTTPAQGSSITVTATGVDALGRTVGDVTNEVTLTSSVGTDQIDGNRVTFPTASPHTLTATHGPTGTVARVTVQVTPATASSSSPVSTDSSAAGRDSSSGGDRLPATGTTTRPWVIVVAVLAMVTGAGTLMRRRPVPGDIA